MKYRDNMNQVLQELEIFLDNFLSSSDEKIDGDKIKHMLDKSGIFFEDSLKENDNPLQDLKYYVLKLYNLLSEESNNDTILKALKLKLEVIIDYIKGQQLLSDGGDSEAGNLMWLTPSNIKNKGTLINYSRRKMPNSQGNTNFRFKIKTKNVGEVHVVLDIHESNITGKMLLKNKLIKEYFEGNQVELFNGISKVTDQIFTFDFDEGEDVDFAFSHFYKKNLSGSEDVDFVI